MRFFGARRRDATPAGAAAAETVRQFDEAVLPHLDAAYSYACHLVRDREVARDIVQDAVLRAVRGFDGLRDGSARAWLLTIVRRCFLDLHAGAGGRHTEALDAHEDDAGLIEPHTPESIAAAREEAARLRHCIAALPQPFREVLVLRELEELPYREIAQVTGAPIGTVMSRLARARRMLTETVLLDAGGGAVS